MEEHRQNEKSIHVAHDELETALRSYTSPVLASSADEPGKSQCPDNVSRKQKQKFKPPRTHLHAEMVKKRRCPEPSDKKEVENVLQALAHGDENAIEAILARNDEIPVVDEWQKRYKTEGQCYWDQFYRQSTINFFKDRNYLREEFAEIMPQEVSADPRKWVDEMREGHHAPPTTLEEAQTAAAGRQVLLEIGCAVGNGVIPMLRANPDLFAFACDLSPVAIDLLKEKEEYRCGRCIAFACDVTCGDLAQLRFAPGHWMGGDLYVRGDGTLSFFFTIEGLIAQLSEAGFDLIECDYKKSNITNRSKGVTMPRIWVQGKFRRR